MFIHDFKKDANVFQTGVHALAVEGNHSVGGVAEDDDAGFIVIGGAFDGDEWEVRVLLELFLEV